MTVHTRTAFLLVATTTKLAFGALPLPAASAPSAASSTAPASGTPVLCQESIPSGRERPKLVEEFPDKVSSGFVANLEVTVEHEPKETVMPGGDQIQLDSKDATALEQVGFILPNPKGPSKMQVERDTAASPARTKVRIPILSLAKDPERKALTLPSLPITIARANGEVFTLCTQPHAITIEDPTASTPDPKPKPNPPPRRQLEEWTTLRQAIEIGTIALIAGALLALLFMWWRRRPKRLPPPPPPRPPWEVAMEELQELRQGNLVKTQRYAEHYDKASDAVRKYLGARFGFDGLESTTKELVLGLRAASVDVGTTNAVELFLRDADLVKFANRTPTEAECWLVLDHAEGFVRATLPTPAENGGSESVRPDEEARPS
ncbi:MAG TPA: hypothetical protein VKP30_17115 [Polyangiaceae bacterium]|nr:hypothetical protein [Polyangiaceae bacterium]